MYVYELVVEITRRCNIKCRHCLRGGAQAKNISNQTIDKILKGVTYISTVTFTGGEPQMAVDRIRYFTQAVKKRGINVGSFYVVTNGKVASLELALALMELYAYCGDKDEVGGLTLSRDQYHKEQIDNVQEAMELYGALTFFRPKDRMENICASAIIKEGRAKEWGCREERLNDAIVGLTDEGLVDRIENLVYVNVLGEVINSCDLSYVSQGKLKIGNVHDQTLAEIYFQYAKEPEEELRKVA